MTNSGETFDAFWQHYLRHHAQEGTRILHVVGTGIAALALVAAIVAVDPLLAWTGHFLVERNRPAMVSHPAWSFVCDVRMFRLWVTGQLGAELKKASVD